jgi:hypothetical protein
MTNARSADAAVAIPPAFQAAREAPIRAVLVGLGAIGSALAEALHRSEGFEVVAAVDPLKEGATAAGVSVRQALSDLRDVEADVAFVSTRSALRDCAEELGAAMTLGFDVVSTCEDLAFPWASDPAVADHLDTVARAHGVRLLSCGVNPGFVMDALPVILATGSLDVTSIRVTRTVDLNRRRPQLAKKLGVGLDDETWRREAAKGAFGHRGLVESAWLCAIGAGWTVRSVSFDQRPLLRDGLIVGEEEVVDLEAEGSRSVRLELRFEVDAVDADSIIIDGQPPLRVLFEGGVHGDQATIARLINCAWSIRGLPPGLRLPIEVPPWAIAGAEGIVPAANSGSS